MNKTTISKKICLETEVEDGLTLGDVIEIKIQEALVDAGLIKTVPFDKAFRHLK